MSVAIVLFLAAVVMTAFGQLFMKLGALRGRGHSLIRSFTDPFTVLGYAFMLGTTVVSTIALRTLPLHLTVSLLPLSYIVVIVLSVAVLHERMQRHHVGGMLLILIGVIIFNVGSL